VLTFDLKSIKYKKSPELLEGKDPFLKENCQGPYLLAPQVASETKICFSKIASMALKFSIFAIILSYEHS
jgi:hypothetical protein